ncbi:DUF188 domain-containing protein [Staphylococcus aureus]
MLPKAPLNKIRNNNRGIIVTHIIIDGDACPVVDSIIDLTTETGIFVTIIGASAIFRTNYILHMYHILHVDDGPDAVDYKIVQLSTKDDIVVTQDYGLASLLVDKVLIAACIIMGRYTIPKIFNNY